MTIHEISEIAGLLLKLAALFLIAVIIRRSYKNAPIVEDENMEL